MGRCFYEARVDSHQVNELRRVSLSCCPSGAGLVSAEKPYRKKDVVKYRNV
jgi:hypothetical protein